MRVEDEMKPTLKIESRKSARRRCRIDSKIRYLNQRAEGRVLDVSRTGISLEVFGSLHASTGSMVVIENKDIGLIEGTVRWCRAGRLGVQIKQSSNTLAQMSAYFRFFHKDMRPILSR